MEVVCSWGPVPGGRSDALVRSWGLVPGATGIMPGKNNTSAKSTYLIVRTIPKTFPMGLGDGQLYTWTDGLKRKDWHDYESMQKDAMRSGKGEQGKPYPLTEEDNDESAYRENGFNIFVSNNIALERSLPDIRHPNCKHKVYLEKLPNTSIIIPFHNEGWTSLLRTIHSIINRTPNSLIAEIILVDDFSDRVAICSLHINYNKSDSSPTSAHTPLDESVSFSYEDDLFD
ncbi:Polypeptide N-acetylgalactosaminyltransferase-like 6 [Varanus komodoensis]|nr:Polypeptide N-acetylgalactosaminyltransferase-like 6 [Varanus komodoensis]